MLRTQSPTPQVGAQTETELKEKKLRVEDALNATKAAVEEGIVIGGGCTLLKLANLVDKIKLTLDNDEQKVSSHGDAFNTHLHCRLQLSITSQMQGSGALQVAAELFNLCYHAVTQRIQASFYPDTWTAKGSTLC